MWSLLDAFFLGRAIRGGRKGPQPAARQLPRQRLRPPFFLESLEDRIVPSSLDVTQYKDNNNNNAIYADQAALTSQNVSSSNFGKIASDPVDGQIYAQPLYISGVNVNGQVLNLAVVATQNDSVYAFNADTGSLVWQTSLINPSQGISAVPATNLSTAAITPIVGITATPVYDPSSGTLYVEDRTFQQLDPNSAPVYTQQLHALDITSGQEVNGGPATLGTTTVNADGTYTNNTAISVLGTGTDAENGVISFNAMTENDRQAMVLDNNMPDNPDGVIYMGFASLGDLGPYHGWLVGYDAKTLQLYSVFNTSPDADHGSLWTSGGGPAIDSQGNLYIAVGDGSFDAYTSTAPPGTSALGDNTRGLGYGGLDTSLAVEFNSDDPVGYSSTGLLYNGVYPTYAPTAPNQYVSLDGTGISFGAGATTASPDTYQATLTYDGSNLIETIVDLTSGAEFTHTYTNINLAQAVGGSTAYVGFTAGSGGNPTAQLINSWTYSTDGSTVIDYSQGFSSQSNLTANGSTQLPGASPSFALLTENNAADLDQGSSLFAKNQVDITNFTTTFSFRMAGFQAPIGEGLTFTIQNTQGHSFQPNYGDSVLKLAPNAGVNQILDSFTPSNAEQLAIQDLDLGSGGVVLLSFPGTAVPNEAVIAGKGGELYLLNADNLGGFSSASSNVLQEMSLGTGGTWGTPSSSTTSFTFRKKGGPSPPTSLSLIRRPTR